jgi:uncharacterized RDD family membrane protein YckC
MSTKNTNNASMQSNVYAPPEARVDDVIPEGEHELASRLSRFGAQFLDGLSIGLIAFAFGLVANFAGYKMDNPLLFQIVISVLALLCFLGINGYFLAKDGQTLGKKALGIRIVRSDGGQATFGRILGLRYAPVWLVSMIPILGGVVALVDVLFIFRESRKCLHDNIADTIVVRA